MLSALWCVLTAQSSHNGNYAEQLSNDLWIYKLLNGSSGIRRMRVCVLNMCAMHTITLHHCKHHSILIFHSNACANLRQYSRMYTHTHKPAAIPGCANSKCRKGTKKKTRKTIAKAHTLATRPAHSLCVRTLYGVCTFSRHTLPLSLSLSLLY